MSILRLLRAAPVALVVGGPALASTDADKPDTIRAPLDSHMQPADQPAVQNKAAGTNVAQASKRPELVPKSFKVYPSF
jgi:hypothetical protein